MRFASSLAGLLAVGPSLIAATATMGFSLGAVNANNTPKDQDTYRADLKAIKANTGSTTIRLYAASQFNELEVLPVAREMGFKVLLGIWVDPAPIMDNYNKDSEAIAAVAEEYKDVILGVTVGSEGLYRGNYTDTWLLKLIQDFRGKVGKETIPYVGTADTWNALMDGRGDALINSPDVNFFAANAFAFWQNDGTDINNASYCFHDDALQVGGHIGNLRDGKDELSDYEFWIGETGWPSDGGGYGDPQSDHYSLASVANAKKFWNEGVCAMLTWGYNTFVFEAFDEPWKPDSTGLNGQPFNETHWGVMDTSRTPKYDLSC